MATKEPYPYMKTLNQILEEHPEWGDIPVGIYTENAFGGYEYVGGSGSVYVSEPTEEEFNDFEDDEYGGPTLVFTGN